MTKGLEKLNCINGSGTFQSEDVGNNSEDNSGKYTLQEEGKSLSHLKTQVDDCLVRKNQRKFSKDIKALPSEECIT